MPFSKPPGHLSTAITRLIQLRGLSESGGRQQLREQWKQVAGERIAAGTRPIGLNRGVLEVSVHNAPLLSEIAQFHKSELLKRWKQMFPEVKVNNLRFKLSSSE